MAPELGVGAPPDLQGKAVRKRKATVEKHHLQLAHPGFSLTAFLLKTCGPYREIPVCLNPTIKGISQASFEMLCRVL